MGSKMTVVFVADMPFDQEIKILSSNPSLIASWAWVPEEDLTLYQKKGLLKGAIMRMTKNGASSLFKKLEMIQI